MTKKKLWFDPISHDSMTNEQKIDQLHDRLDLLQLRVYDLEKLAETQNTMFDLLLKLCK